jgi:aryl-alcohol dehydrogenase-like predicted oxidoreductase
MRLGFGCGGLSAGRNLRHSLHLLETAVDCGITYFDTARLYGEGTAESVLGRLTPGLRHRILLASKAGILPTHRSIMRRALERGAIELRKTSLFRDAIAEPAVATPRFHVFGLRDIEKSVEKSLRQLNTDYLDLLLLHECRSEDINFEILDFLKRLQNRGKIREFGIATDIEETLSILDSYPDALRVIQIPSSIWTMNIARVPHSTNRIIVTHSALAQRFRALNAKFRSDPAFVSRWRSLTVDPRNISALAGLFLCHAVRANPDGIVLFSSSKADHIKAAVGSVRNLSNLTAELDGLTAAVTAELIS